MKKTLNEDKQITEDTSWWIRGDGSEDIAKKQAPSIISPLYLVNDVQHAYEYAVKHNGKSLMTVYELDLNKGNVGVKILDLTSPDDLEKIGYSKLLAKVFSEVDAYFSWSMTSSFSDDRVWRPRELDFAYRFLLWKNGKAIFTYVQSKSKDKASSKSKSTLYHLIESKSTKFENALESDLQNEEFLDEYVFPRFNQDDLRQLRLDIVNAYIDTFKTINGKWDKAARKVVREKGVPMYVDNMLVMLMQDIKSAGYDGYFCPELKSRAADGDDCLTYVSTTVRDGTKKVDTIAIMTADAVKQVFQCDAYDFEAFADAMPDKQRATKNSLKTVIGLMQKCVDLADYVNSKWSSRNPLGYGFSKQIKDAAIAAAKDPEKCLWHVWTDAREISKINVVRDIVPQLDIVLAAPCGIEDSSQLLSQPMIQKILEYCKLDNVKEGDYKHSKLEAWRDKALKFEKISIDV